MHSLAQDRYLAHQHPPRDHERPTMKFLLVREAAPIMRMDDSTLYRHLRADRFPAVKIGGRYLIPEAAVLQMAEEAVRTGRCVIVEEWAARWRAELAANALAQGTSQRTVDNRPRPGANQTGAGVLSTQQVAGREVSSMTDATQGHTHRGRS